MKRYREPISRSLSLATPARRFFQVTVAVDGDQMKVVTLPSPVEAPAQGKAPTLAYTEQLSTSDPAGETTMQFLGAYLAGAGDLTRFISPDAAITAVSPAQFVQIDPVEREDYRKIGCLDAEVAAAGLVRRLVWRIKAGDRSRVQDRASGDLSAITESVPSRLELNARPLAG